MRTKEEKREYDRQYRLKNKEKIKQYRINNKDKIRETRLKYDEANKDKIKSQQISYKENNKEKIKQYQIQYFIEHKEEIKQCPSNSPENRKIVDKKYRDNNKNKIRGYKLIKNYGITLDEYNTMFDNQKGRCAICNTHQDILRKRLVVDHDHNTNVVRGLLCDKCNRGLGHFNDDIEIITKAVEYLSNVD